MAPHASLPRSPAFTFLYSPMGKMFGHFQTPFGMDRNLFLFIAARDCYRQRD